MSRGTWCLVVLAVVVVSGCTDDPPPPQEPISSSVASPTAVSSPSKTEAAPELPDAATTYDAPGAEAFVQHWVDVLNYAYRSGDVEALDALSLPDCTVCSSNITQIRTAYVGDGHITGADATVTLVRSPPPDPDGVVSVSAQLRQPEYDVVGPDGTTTADPGAPLQNVGFVLDWIDGAWQLVGIGSE